MQGAQICPVITQKKCTAFKRVRLKARFKVRLKKYLASLDNEKATTWNTAAQGLSNWRTNSNGWPTDEIARDTITP